MNSVEIELGYGYVALIDGADYALVSKHRWYAQQCPRGVRIYATIVTAPGVKAISLHRFLMSPAPGMVVDHINGDGLDNRRDNLRVCSRGENARNRVKHAEAKSVFKGVTRSSKSRAWIAQCQFGGKKIHIGSFKSEEEAARAYDTAAKQFFGPFARLNFPEQIEAPSNGSFFKPLGSSECETICSSADILRAGE